MIAPCMECPDRHVGCHGKCEKYKKYTEEQDKWRKKVNSAKSVYFSYRATTGRKRRPRNKNGYII